MRRGSSAGGGADEPEAATDAAGGDASQDEDEPPLGAMRAVWLAMRDEAPPERGLSELLAAARRRAEDMAEARPPKPTRWQRLLAALRRPPVLALATAMVLIGGGVLIGRRVADPPAARVVDAFGEPAGGPGSPPTEAASPVAPTPVAPSAPRAKGWADGAGATGEPSVRDPRKKAAERVSVLRGSSSPPPRGRHGEAGSGGPVVDDPPSVAASPAADRGAADSTGEGTEDASLSHPRGQPSRPTPAQLYEQCESAARRGDCAAVRRIVEQITRRDRAYRDRIAKEAAVAKCLVE